MYNIIGEFGIIYHGIYTPDINKPSKVVAVKTLKGEMNITLVHDVNVQ